MINYLNYPENNNCFIEQTKSAEKSFKIKPTIDNIASKGMQEILGESDKYIKHKGYRKVVAKF